jgi:hypothetical protein
MPSGRSIVGREVFEDGYGGWIRPVSARHSKELSREERQYENGDEPQVLDVIEIPLIAAVPSVHHTENHLIDPAYYWTKKGALAWVCLAGLVDTPSSLWRNGDSTEHGVNDRVSQAYAHQLANSIFFIKPETLSVHVQQEVGMFDNPTRRARADFVYNGTHYNFMITDPLAEEAFLVSDNEVFPVSNAYLCVSLTGAYEGDAYCHKIVESVMSRQPYEMELEGLSIRDRVLATTERDG